MWLAACREGCADLLAISVLCTLRIFSSALERIQPRVVSYEEQATVIREQLAKLLEDEEDWTKAAQTLAGIDLDSGAETPS